ncbi:protein V57 [Psittacid alphaherpesvirus 1]|uniref:protein V57 n=1 Tax=Psittacid alphaherpesvirus 1 TaxID=50294 RepID=UPI000153681B|nr:protein V57 [Psittacid alphaherpesvirus 1]
MLKRRTTATTPHTLPENGGVWKASVLVRLCRAEKKSRQSRHRLDKKTTYPDPQACMC